MIAASSPVASPAPNTTRRAIIAASRECRYALDEPFHHERELTLEAGDRVRVQCRYDANGRYHVRVLREVKP